MGHYKQAGSNAGFNVRLWGDNLILGVLSWDTLLSNWESLLISHLRNQLNVIERVEKKEKPKFKSVRNSVMHGNLEEALKDLAAKFEQKNKSEYNSIILLTSRYNSLSKSFNLGLINFEEYSRSLNQITYAILEIIKLDEE